MNTNNMNTNDMQFSEAAEEMHAGAADYEQARAMRIARQFAQAREGERAEMQACVAATKAPLIACTPINLQTWLETGTLFIG